MVFGVPWNLFDCTPKSAGRICQREENSSNKETTQIYSGSECINWYLIQLLSFRNHSDVCLDGSAGRERILPVWYSSKIQLDGSIKEMRIRLCNLMEQIFIGIVLISIQTNILTVTRSHCYTVIFQQDGFTWEVRIRPVDISVEIEYIFRKIHLKIGFDPSMLVLVFVWKIRFKINSKTDWTETVHLIDNTSV